MSRRSAWTLLTVGTLLLAPLPAGAVHCEGGSRMACVEGVDQSGRAPLALYEAAREALLTARTPAEGRLAVRAMFEAFNPQLSDWRAIYCNVHSPGGFAGFQECMKAAR